MYPIYIFHGKISKNKILTPHRLQICVSIKKRLPFGQSFFVNGVSEKKELVNNGKK